MRCLSVLPLALVASAFVLPDAEIAERLEVQNAAQQPQVDHPFWDKIKNPSKIWEELEQKFDDATENIANTVDRAFESAHNFADEAYGSADAEYASVVDYSKGLEHTISEAWLEGVDYAADLFDDEPHGPPPHHGPPEHERPPPRHRPHHPPHHHTPNLTVYQLIAKSQYTTKLAGLINQFPDLVETLNGTEANYTVFAPTDKAFEKIPEHAPKPSKEFLKKLLTYHVSPEFYPAGRVLVSRTIPTALQAEKIGKVPQRLATQIGFRGLTVNFYARVVAIDIFGTNGVIHGLDSILVPPPKVVDIISAFPGEFSTLELGLYKTGLYEVLNNTALHHGGTLFAPSNFAFKLLGPRINAFLFSKYGEKYLKALLLYHATTEATIYSDAIYTHPEKDAGNDLSGEDAHRIPKGQTHIDVETGLEGKSLSIDIRRFGRLITILINGFTRVSRSDGVAADGVINVLPRVLIPPREGGGPPLAADELSLEDFKDALAPYVEGVVDDEFEL